MLTEVCAYTFATPLHFGKSQLATFSVCSPDTCNYFHDSSSILLGKLLVCLKYWIKQGPSYMYLLLLGEKSVLFSFILYAYSWYHKIALLPQNSRVAIQWIVLDASWCGQPLNVGILPRMVSFLYCVNN